MNEDLKTVKSFGCGLILGTAIFLVAKVCYEFDRNTRLKIKMTISLSRERERLERVRVMLRRPYLNMFWY